MLLDTHLRILFNQKRAQQMMLQNLEIPTDGWDPILIYLITQRLHSESLQLWEQTPAGQDSAHLQGIE